MLDMQEISSINPSPSPGASMDIDEYTVQDISETKQEEVDLSPEVPMGIDKEKPVAQGTTRIQEPHISPTVEVMFQWLLMKEYR